MNRLYSHVQVESTNSGSTDVSVGAEHVPFLLGVIDLQWSEQQSVQASPILTLSVNAAQSDLHSHFAGSPEQDLKAIFEDLQKFGQHSEHLFPLGGLLEGRSQSFKQVHVAFCP